MALVLYAILGGVFAVIWTACVAYVGSISTAIGLGAAAQGIYDNNTCSCALQDAIQWNYCIWVSLYLYTFSLCWRSFAYVGQVFQAFYWNVYFASIFRYGVASDMPDHNYYSLNLYGPLSNENTGRRFTLIGTVWAFNVTLNSGEYQFSAYNTQIRISSRRVWRLSLSAHSIFICMLQVLQVLQASGWSSLKPKLTCACLCKKHCITFSKSPFISLGFCTFASSNSAGILNGLFVGVGSGSGSIIGGLLISKVGIRATYRLFAAFLVLIILFFLACHWQGQGTDEDGDDSKSAYRAVPSQEEDLGEWRYTPFSKMAPILISFCLYSN